MGPDGEGVTCEQLCDLQHSVVAAGCVAITSCFGTNATDSGLSVFFVSGCDFGISASEVVDSVEIVCVSCSLGTNG